MELNGVSDFVQESFRVDSDEETSTNRVRQIFPDKTGPLWTTGRYLFYGVSLIAHISLVVTFLSFFVTAFSFSLNCALEIVLEMITPTGDSRSRRNFYAACLFILLLCVLIVSSFVLSLFWKVLTVVLYKSSLKYVNIKIGLFIVVLISAGIWSGVTKSAQSGFILFLSKCLIVAWVAAFILSLLGSLVLLVFVYKAAYDMKSSQVTIPWGITNLVLTIFSILSPIAFKLVGASSGGIAFAFLFPFSTFLLLIYLFFRGSKEEGNDFVVRKEVLVLICIFFFVIVVVGTNVNITCGEECQLGPPSKKSTFMLKYSAIRNTPNVPGYPICNKKWSALQLGITDMAYLANTAYKIQKDNETHIHNLVNDYFKDRNIKWIVESVNAKKPFYFHIRNPDKKVNVFSIRGTVDSRDWFENLKMWNEIAVFQIISLLLPVQHLPFEFVAFFISKSASVDYLLHRSTYGYYFEPLEDYVKTERDNSESEEYFLVGHSLGGGLAKIIGSRNKIPAIAISSPGDIYNHMKFDYTLEDVQKYTTTVRAQNDLVTWIDRSGGLVQYIECDNSDFLKCHSISKTYCELKKKCHATTLYDCPGDPSSLDLLMDKLRISTRNV